VRSLNLMEEQIRAHLDRKQYAEAFELMVRQYQNKIFHMAYSMLGNRALAEDAVQESFLRIWRGLSGFRGLSSLSTWIYAIARNACLSAAESNAARKAISLEEPAVRLAAEGRHAAASAHASAVDVGQLVAQLPEKYRQVIALFYMEDKSYAEVARLLDLPMGTVKTYLHRAKKELAAAMLASKMKGGSL